MVLFFIFLSKVIMQGLNARYRAVNIRSMICKQIVKGGFGDFRAMQLSPPIALRLG
jgi:hypothetical protein